MSTRINLFIIPHPTREISFADWTSRPTLGPARFDFLSSTREEHDPLSDQQVRIINLILKISPLPIQTDDDDSDDSDDEDHIERIGNLRPPFQRYAVRFSPDHPRADFNEAFGLIGAAALITAERARVSREAFDRLLSRHIIGPNPLSFRNPLPTQLTVQLPISTLMSNSLRGSFQIPSQLRHVAPREIFPPLSTQPVTSPLPVPPLRSNPPSSPSWKRTCWKVCKVLLTVLKFAALAACAWIGITFLFLLLGEVGLILGIGILVIGYEVRYG
ncbi:MAG: hypothetical protein KGJ02_08575 [Verrucomicrobiota bacterium]|nr:hypothetical protein [Verrucomicrobiota bacterium]